MPLGKDLSIVADSTVSSSPLRDSAKSEIKRPTRTYGRKKSPPAEDIEASTSSSLLAAPSRASVHQTGPPGLDEEVPPSSQTSDDEGTVETHGGLEKFYRASSGFQFEWRAQLKAMDDEIDFPDSQDASKIDQSLSSQPSSKDAPLDDSFAGPLSTITATSPRSVDHSAPPSSPLISERRRRTKKPTTLLDSDSDGELGNGTHSSNSSPSALHRINTPEPGFLSTLSASDGGVTVAPMMSVGEGRNMKVDHVEQTIPHNKSRKPKVKAPTKKDFTETAKARARIATEKERLIPRPQRDKHTLQRLFSVVKNTQSSMQVPSDPPSSPRSSAVNIFRPISPSSVHPFQGEQCPPIIPPTIPAAESDDEFPEPELLYEERIATKKREDIQALKQRALVEKQNAPLVSEDEDDDLVVLPSPEKGTTRLDEEHHRSTSKGRPSEGRKVQLNFAGMNLSMQKSGAAPKLGPLNNVGSSTSRRKSGITRDELNTSLWSKVKGDIRETIHKKEADYMKAGGRILISEGPAEVSEKSLNVLVEKGLKAAEARMAGAIENDSDNEDEEDEDDDDWMPEGRGSASPEPEPDEGQGAAEVMADDVGGDVLIDDLNDQENINTRSSHRRRTVFYSDDEDDEPKPRVQHPSHNNVLPDKPPTMILESEDYMSASADERVENETDKENDTGLMFDYSEDKENKAVVRHAELGPLGRSLSLRGETQRSSAMSSPDLGEGLDSRRPFQELVGGDSSQDMQLAPTNLTQTFASQLRTASSHLSTNSSTSIPAACIGNSDLDEFQKISGKTSSSNAAASIVLQPSFSDLFESATEKQGDARPLASFKDKEKAVSISLNQIRRSDTLDLTQDMTLLPAFQAGDNVLRKADIIFEKEQDYLLENAGRKNQQSAELYVNDDGFLTQTRPDVHSPEIYKPASPSQSRVPRDTLFSPTGFRSAPRAPLGTLSFSGISQHNSPDGGPLSRLRRATDNQSSDSPGTRKRPADAFDLLRQGAAKEAKAELAWKRHEALEFFEDEAQESDEDDAFGFGTKHHIERGEEEDEDEDLDKTLETLVDDQEMGEEVVAAEKILEKFHEQAEEDDQALERLHQAAVRGELRRKKRHHGVGMDDSEDESDDEDQRARRARHSMKRARVDRDDVKALEANPETKAFAESYMQTVLDDGNDFDHLADASQESSRTLVGDDDEEGDVNVGKFTRDDLIRQIYDGGLEDEDYEMDLTDTLWIDGKDEEDHIRVKAVKFNKRMAGASIIGATELDDGLEFLSSVSKSNQRQRNQEQSWMKREGKIRNSGTSRSVGGAAVTSLGGSALRKVSRASLAGAGSAPPVNVPKPVKAAESFLSAVDRTNRFA